MTQVSSVSSMHLSIFAILFGFVFANRVSYDGYKVLRFSPNLRELNQLNEFKNQDGFDFWVEPYQLGANLDIMVSPAEQPLFLDFLEKNKINYTILFDNIQEAIDAEYMHQRMMKRLKPSLPLSFDRYYRHNEINEYLQQLASIYPHLVKLENIGKSYEGRDMIFIKISSGGNGNRPAIFIDAGIHAREWISPAMALYIIHQLVENSAANSNLTSGVDWYILPVLNPDGYEYSHTTARMWRKTRSPTNVSRCPGVDANRNFEFHWMEKGASSRPCSGTYGGHQPFSEAEIRNLRDFVTANKHRIKLYLTFHSYGGYVLYPWGYTTALPSDVRTLHTLAERVNKAHLAAGGEPYVTGTIANALSNVSGSSVDYMKGIQGIELSYVVELTNTTFGFHLPAELISPTVSRFFEGVREYGNYVKDN